MKKNKIALLPLALLLSATMAHAQVHTNDFLWYNNGAEIYIGSGLLVTVSGDITNNKAGVAPVNAHLQNEGFIWAQGNLYGDNAFKQTGSGTLRLQNKTALFTAPYAAENYQTIEGGYRVNGGKAAIGAADDGSFYTLELDNQNGLVFAKTNTDVRGSVDFKPASVTVDGNTLAPNGTANRILTYNPGTAAAPAAAPVNGSAYTTVFGMMNKTAGLSNFKNLSTNLTTNTATLDNAYIQGKLRRALDAAAGGAYGFPLGLEPSTGTTDAKGIQYALLDFGANNYDVLTGYFEKGSSNTITPNPAPGVVCNAGSSYLYYGASNHGEWKFTPATYSAEAYKLTIYPQDYGVTASKVYFITKDDAVPVPGTPSCGSSPLGLSCANMSGFSEFGFAGADTVVPCPISLVLTPTPSATVCSGEAISIAVTGNASASITWSNTAGQTGTGTPINFAGMVNQTAANKTLTYKVIAANSTCSDTETITMTIKPAPNLVVKPSIATICPLEQTNLLATATSPTATINWTRTPILPAPASGTGTGSVTVNQPLPAGIYNYQFTATENGCTSAPANATITAN